jgi:hypothetical protein
MSLTILNQMGEKIADDEENEKSDTVGQLGKFTGASFRNKAGQNHAGQGQAGQSQTGAMVTNLHASDFDSEIDNAQTNIYSPKNNMNQASFEQNNMQQSNPDQAAQYGYATTFGNAAGNTANMNTPSNHGRAQQYTQSAGTTSYPWETTPVAYNSNFLQNTPQTVGYGTSYSNFPSMSMNSDATPSHMPKKVGKNPVTTPQSESAYSSQYNQTEPRNFAPRAGTAPAFVPPPTFNLSRQDAVTSHEETQYMAQASDPFMSPGAKSATDYGYSQALVLGSVPEENQMALASQQLAYGPVPAEIRAVRSVQLNRLTEGPIGLPSREVALDHANFPFIESATQAAPVGYGVIKIRNVSNSASVSNAFFSGADYTRSPSPRSAPRSSPSWAATPRS